MKRLENKTAIITGATSGIGEATVRRFVAEGAKVVFAGRREEEGMKLMADLPEGSAFFVKTDVTVREDLQNLIDTALEKMGHIDILINNAGIMKAHPFETYPMEEFDQMMRINFRSVVELTQMVLPHMLEREYGVILSTSSMGARTCGQAMEAYCCSKAAVLTFSRCIAKEFATRGIRCNAMLPGGTRTEGMMPAGGRGEARIMAVTPMKRPGLPEEIAAGYVYLASDEAAFVTGAAFSVDGGACCFN